MANYDFTVSDIIDPQAVKELKELDTQFKNATESYKNLAKALAGATKVNPNTLAELSKKTENLTAINNELINTQKSLKDIQSEYLAKLKEIEKSSTENAKALKAEAEANRANAQAELASAKAKTETIKQEKILNQEKRKTKVTEEEVSRALNTEAKSISQARDQIKTLTKARNELNLSDATASQRLKELNLAIDTNNEFVRRNVDSVTKQKMTIGDYKEQVKAAIVELKNGGSAFKNFGIVANGVGGILKGSLSSGMAQITTSVGTMIKGFVGAQAVVKGIQSLVSAFKSGITSVIDFEESNSKLAAILGTTSANMKDLISDAKRLGAATKYTASQATELQTELAKLGFSRQEILDATEYVLRFAQATGSSLPDAAALAGSSLRAFGADAKETERYVSAMAVATTKSALSFSYLQTALPIVSPVAKAFNFTIEDTLALLGKLADAGFDASSASTATRNILLNLADANGALAKSLGGSVKTLPELVNGLKTLRERGVDLNETLELTDKRSVAAFNAFLLAADGLEELKGQITGVESELTVMADTMDDNVRGAIYALESAWEAFMLSFSGSTGVAKDVINFFANGIRNIATELQSLEEQQSGREARAVSETKSQMQQFNVIGENTKRVQELYNELLASGMSAQEADAEAKRKYLESYNQSVEAQKSLYKEAQEEQLSLQDKYNNASFFKQALFLEKTNKQYEKAIEQQGTILAELASGIYKDQAVIDAISSIQLSPVEEDTTVRRKELSEKEKRELEKQAKEILRIKQEAQESELNLMDDGIEKEIAKISFSYSKRIAAIRGNSKEEQKTRENLAIEMQNAIDSHQMNYSIEQEKTNINNRLAAVESGSKEELELREELLIMQRQQELIEAEKTGADVYLIAQKYNSLIENARKKHAENVLKIADDEIKKQADAINAQQITEQLALNEKYTSGKIKKEEYEKESLEIQKKYALESIQVAIDTLQKRIDVEGALPEEREALEAEIAKLQTQYAKLASDYEVDVFEKTEDAAKKLRQEIASALEYVSQMVGEIGSLFSNLYEGRINEIEEQQEANQAAYDKEIETIEKLLDRGAISEEEAEARKRYAEEQTAAKEAELAQQKAAIQTRQAKMEKATNITQIIMSTAAGIMKAWGQLGAFGAPMAALIGAMGAVQLATAIAQPIPKYAKGTDNHKGGLAIVGDGGKHEVISTKLGMFLTPDIPTLVDMPAGAKVFPNALDPRLIKSDLSLMLSGRFNQHPAEQPIIINDYTALGLKMDAQNKMQEVRIKESRATNRILRKNIYIQRAYKK